MMIKQSFERTWRNHTGSLVLLLALCMLIVEWLFLEYALSYDPFNESGDVSDYWRNSQSWRSAFEPHHSPGYPIFIAATRAIVGNFLAQQAIMTGIVFVAFLVAVMAVFQIAKDGINSNQPWISVMAAALFVLWPMVGLTYVATPIADMFSMAPLLLGWWLLSRNRPFPASIFLGLAMFSHKGTWPFAVLLMVGYLIANRTLSSFIFAGVMFLPIGILWLLGTIYNDSPVWMFSADIDWSIDSSSSLPILDGILGSIMFGGFSGVGKGMIVIGEVLLALAVILRAWRLPNYDQTKWFSLAIAFAVILSILILNEKEIWATVRFGRLLALPVAMIYGGTIVRAASSNIRYVYGIVFVLFSMILSQFAFSYYMAKVWVPYF